MTRILLIRHGESVLGSQGRYAGHVDTPLTSNGRRQSLRLRQRFQKFHVDQVFSSDLCRCCETAEILAPQSNIIHTEELRELHFGRWEGQTSDSLARAYPSLYRRWLDDPQSVSPPGGESLTRLAERIRCFVGDLARRAPGQTIALITHGGPIRILLARRLDEFWKPEAPPACLFLHNVRETREALP